MKNRLAALCAALTLSASVLLAGAGVVSASAAPSVLRAQVPLTAASGTCENIGTYNSWVYANASKLNGWLPTGAQGDWYDSGRIWPCTGIDGSHGPSYWVALEVPGSGKSIVQIGVAYCYTPADPENTACQNTPRYFWSWGYASGTGCGTSHDPKAYDLGAATYGWHHFNVWWDKDNHRVRFYIDSTEETNISDANLCWLNSSSSIASFSGERQDGGDGVGDVNYPLYERNGRAGYYQHGWNNPYFSNCYATLPDLYCQVFSNNTDAINMWTIQP